MSGKPNAIPSSPSKQASSSTPRATAQPQQAFPGVGHSLAPPPSYENEVKLLVEMGFGANAARSALQKCNGEVERAIGLLSEGGGAASGPPDIADPPPQAGVGAAATAAMARATVSDIPALCEALASIPSAGGTALQLLRKLVGNVRDAPADPKYRKVRLTNPKISAALGGRLEAFARLAACGFKLDQTGEHAEMGEATAADAPALEWACVSLDEAVTMAANGGPPVPPGPTDVKVLVAPEGQPMRFDEVGDDFYALTPAEAKAIMEANAAKRAKEERFLTREQREAERMKSRRLYRKAMIRVRFPDGIVLQATFAASSPVSLILTWVEEALREPGQPFELAIARGQPLSELTMSIEHSDLAPAALLNFRCTNPGGMNPPYLHGGLMGRAEMMGAEAIPQGYGGESAAGQGAMGAQEMPGGGRPPRGDPNTKAPAWMRQQ